MIDTPNAELTLTLPDGSARRVPYGTLPRDVVAGIGAGLLRAAVAVQLDGNIQDLVTPLRSSGSFRVLTEKDAPALDVLRHSAAHLLATAVRRLRPDAKIGFGPSIDDGFYYDFEVAQPFTPEDLDAFEKEMKKAAQEKFPFVRDEVSRADAQKKFSDDPLKLERLSELGDDEVISVYTDGPFFDLCRGPHVPDTSRIKHFKLLHTAGAYWRGDEHRQMLQRIYGTAWFTKDELDAYLVRLEEAKKRDHRTLGRELDLYSTDQRVGPGLILWHPRGAVDPQRDRELRARSHHAARLRSRVYAAHREREALRDLGPPRELQGRDVQRDGRGRQQLPSQADELPGAYLHLPGAPAQSYRDLPLRFAEFGTVYRYERSGVLHGMLRVRGFTQDDAHVFCTPEQVPGEIERLLDLVDEMLKTFGYPYTIELSTMPPNALGTAEVWAHAEKTLRRRAGPARAGVHDRRGRRRLLRAQARFQADRRDRPQLAGPHRAARFQPARALPARVRRRGQQECTGRSCCTACSWAAWSVSWAA